MPTVLITGAGRGIGRAAALWLARAGWDVYAGVRRAEVGEELRAAAPTGRLTPVILDVTSAADIAALPAQLPERLDALVNNAGIAIGGPVETVPADELRRQLEVNVTGPIALTQALVPRLRAANGRIVFISSVGGRMSTPFLGPYSASKFALEALADSLRIELRPWDVKVVLLEPGAIDTDIWDSGAEQADEAEAAMTPEQRDLYAPQITGLRKTIGKTKSRSVSPDKVAGVLERALTTRRPKARYPVGSDAHVQLRLLRVLPTRVVDAMLARIVVGSR
ncbi:MAG: SDR family oxidoreductase [Solirubrobacteraceae bacterium]|nr:SDR family oxidoreductase [Solirubrobacteraceae bacterium]